MGFPGIEISSFGGSPAFIHGVFFTVRATTGYDAETLEAEKSYQCYYAEKFLHKHLYWGYRQTFPAGPLGMLCGKISI
jgi:hypothetical protein